MIIIWVNTMEQHLVHLPFSFEDITHRSSSWQNIVSLINSYNYIFVQVLISRRTEGIWLWAPSQITTKMTTFHHTFVRQLSLVSTKCSKIKQYWRSCWNWILFLHMHSTSYFAEKERFSNDAHPKDRIKNEEALSPKRSVLGVTSSEEDKVHTIIHYHGVTESILSSVCSNVVFTIIRNDTVCHIIRSNLDHE